MAEWAVLLDSAARGQNWENCGKSIPGMLMGGGGWGKHLFSLEEVL